MCGKSFGVATSSLSQGWNNSRLAINKLTRFASHPHMHTLTHAQIHTCTLTNAHSQMHTHILTCTYSHADSREVYKSFQCMNPLQVIVIQVQLFQRGEVREGF